MKTDNPVFPNLPEQSRLTKMTRRSFVQGVLAAGVGTSLYGCSKDSDGEIIYQNKGSGSTTTEPDDIYYTKNPIYSYGAPGHNCGGQCLTKAQLTREGRIVRIFNEDVNQSYDGTFFDINHRNSPLTRACSRCRSYKGRLYHPGRLRYPLKQTKERGDMSGFVRISWPQAIKEIIERLKAVQKKYGYEAFHSITANGNYASSVQGGGQCGPFANSDLSIHWQGAALRLLGGSTMQASDYSYHQGYQMGGMAGETWVGNHTPGVNLKPSTNDIAGCGKYVFLMGSNKATTNNTNAYSWRKALEDMKARDPESRIIYISPELSEGATSVADEWVQMKPYTDAAFYNAMVCEMIMNTVDENGNVYPTPAEPTKKPWLDLDYIDTLVYGFFDSPGYWHNEATGEIDLTIPAPNISAGTPVESNGKREFQLASGNSFGGFSNTTGTAQKICWIDSTPNGKSWSAYLMGSDNRLTKCAYGEGNYTAQKYTTANPAIKRNSDICKYPSSSSGKYAYKNDMMTRKDANWGEKITGIPADKIRELAELFVKAGKNKEPLYIEWSGGSFKQANGCYTIFAMQAAQIISKNWGITGSGYSNMISPVVNATPPDAQVTVKEVLPSTWGSPYNFFLPNSLGGAGTADVPVMRNHPMPSGTQWHNAVKFAFGDILKLNGYDPNIPDWKEGPATGRAYVDDAGVKSLVTRRSGNTDSPYAEIPTFTYQGTDGIKRTYYEYDGHNIGLADGVSQPAGFRFLFNVGGNIAISQHMNTTDTYRMYKALPTYGYDDPKRNISDMADAFYLVTFENIMAPGAQYSDYVLPAATSWEQADFIPLLGDKDNIFFNNVVTPPGEAISTWELAREFAREYGGEKAAKAFTGGNGSEDFKDVFQEKYYKSGFYTKTQTPLEEYMKKPYVRSKPNTETTYTISTNQLRKEIDDYVTKLNKTPGTVHAPHICKINTPSTAVATFYSHVGRDFAETETCPRASKKFQMYSGSLVWQYENAFSKWHSHLPLEQQGHKNKDSEQDPEVYPIPMYLHFQDWFREAYGLADNSELEGRFVMTTSHPKYRSHSTHAVNPYLREMSNSIINGSINSGNDAGDYAVSKGNFISFDTLNRLIGKDGLPVPGAEGKASYSDILVNDKDFADWNDGTLVKVENEIGAVYCTIRKTARCVRGYVNLNEGSWFDPRMIDGRLVCVGGAANTLMASTPSRIDHGNAQQSAMVKITKVR